MWLNIASIILRNRLALLLSLGVVTAFMGYEASRVQLSYEFARVLPVTDQNYIDYQKFRTAFGEDGSVLVVGFEDPDIFQLKKFNELYDLSNEIQRADGIEQVVSVARIFRLEKNDTIQKFRFNPVFTKRPQTQAELDSLKNVVLSLSFYEGLLFTKESNATMMAITFDKQKLNTKNRIRIVEMIKSKVNAFGSRNHVKIHLSGLPYIRTEISNKVAAELIMFLLLGILVTGIILFAFFRSFNVVLFSLLVVIMGVVWSLGTITLLGYKITLLTGLIPPLIIIIGVPNSILLLNKFQIEFQVHGNRIKALTRTITKIGITTFLANVTTAIGFGVFYFTNSELLVEFGLVAAINVMATYVISLVFIPIIFSLLPEPSTKHTAHLKGKWITRLLVHIDYWVHNYRTRIYAIVLLAIGVSLIGMYNIKSIGYVVDDLPKDHPVYLDMKFFEKTIKGVLPLEITIDTKEKNQAFDIKVLHKINKLQKVLASYPEFSKPLSVVEGIKYAYQSYREGDPKYYVLPGAMELSNISPYFNNSKGDDDDNTLKAFVDSNKQVTRVSVQMADVGSIKMKELLKELQPRIDSIFPPKKYHVTVTGSSLMFLKGNDYLLSNLKESVLLAIFLISMIMFMLFMSFRMISISVLPSLIPLLITAGLMGYFHIALKPSTILIFSIAFGISSDYTIYFLTKYRQELIHHNGNISKVVSISIRETGVSMVYAAFILFAGFSIFIASGFGGTQALGVLISFTLIVAVCTNLVLLPCFLLTLEKRLTTDAFLSEPLLQVFEEDEDIELDDLEIKKNNPHSSD